MISKWAPIFKNSIRLQLRNATRLDRNVFWSSSRKPSLNQAGINGKIEEGKHAFQHEDLTYSEKSEKVLMMNGPLISQDFGRFNGFSGENKFYFLQVTGILLLLNIVTRLVFSPKQVESRRAKHL